MMYNFVCYTTLFNCYTTFTYIIPWNFSMVDLMYQCLYNFLYDDIKFHAMIWKHLFVEKELIFKKIEIWSDQLHITLNFVFYWLWWVIEIVMHHSDVSVLIIFSYPLFFWAISFSLSWINIWILEDIIYLILNLLSCFPWIWTHPFAPWSTSSNFKTNTIIWHWKTNRYLVFSDLSLFKFNVYF